MNTEITLLQIHGPIMTSRAVQEALHFRTPEGLRSARRTGRLKLSMFKHPSRRGLFAKTADVAALLDTFVQESA